VLARHLFNAGPIRRIALLAALTLPSLAAAGGLGACEGEGDGGAGGGSGAGGAGGCPLVAEANFTIVVHAESGPVPQDTTVHIAWSAGAEPTFALDDPTTWKTLEDANIVCAVDHAKPPPADLPVLVCKLWTTGATRVEISASGYATYDRTLTPTVSELCEGVLPQEVDIELVAAVEEDGG
jgi:hypothetical protein